MAYTKFKPLVYKYIFTRKLEDTEIPKYALEYLRKDEKILSTFKTMHDLVIFTDTKIILFDKGGVAKNMKEVFVIPHKNISTCGVKYRKLTSKIFIVMNNSYPLDLKFTKNIHKSIVKETYISIIDNLDN